MSDKPVKLIVLSDPARGKSFELTESFYPNWTERRG